MQSLGERDTTERQHGGYDYNEGGEVEQEAIDVIDVDDLLGQHLDHIGDTLYGPVRSHPVRSDTTLKKGTHFTLHVDQHERDHGVSQQQAKPDKDKLNQRGSRLREKTPQEFIYPLCYC